MGSHPKRPDPTRGAGELRRLRRLDPRDYDWDLDDLVERDCPLCGAEGRPRLRRPDELILESCEPCGAWFVSPAPSQRQLDRLYRDYHGRHRVEAFRNTAYHHRHRLPSFQEPAALAAHVRKRRPMGDLRIQELSSLIELEGARVLDVGCGTGGLLWNLSRLGAEVTGIDVDPEAIAFVRDALGFDSVRRGTIEEVSGEPPFDLVVLQDILEHVLRPREMLERAVGLLRPGGLIYLWTPNATLAGAEDEPQVFRGDLEHLQFLQARTAAFLARELGLEVLHLEAVGYLGSQEEDLDGGGRARRSRLGAAVKGLLRRVPGFQRLNRLRLDLQGRHLDRCGTYHLFVILRKGVGA